MNAAIRGTYKWCKRIAICLIGGTVLLVGVCMIVLPGPAFVVIPLGLAILGLEFAWARRWMRKMKEQAQNCVPGLKPAGANSGDAADAASPAADEPARERAAHVSISDDPNPGHGDLPFSQVRCSYCARCPPSTAWYDP